jgi:hypothetical protein
MKLFEESILDNKTFFYYILIIIGIIFAFSTTNIGLNIVFGTIIASFVVYYLYNNYKEKQETENKTKSFQEANLLPKPEIFSDHADMVKYLFSIQDFYIYNPQAYEEMTEYLSLFFRTYKEAKENKKQASINHGLMLTYKSGAINALHSIVHSLPDTTDYTDKLNRAISILQEILNEYLNKTEKMHKEYLFEYGYNNQTKLIHKGELPYNAFGNDKSFTYSLF